MTTRLWLLAVLSSLALSAASAAELPFDSRLTDRSALWERDGKNLLSGFRNMYQLDVVLDERDPAYPYRGWFFGWASDDGNTAFSGCDAIFALRSPSLEAGWQVWAGEGTWDDGTHPETWVPVISARDEFYDEWHNGDPSVVLHDGRFFMAYSSTGRNLDGKLWGEAGDTDGSILCVMGAVSDDGLHWTSTEKPIAMCPSDVGAPSVPDGESHLYGSYQRPTLLFDEGRFRLWFDYWAGTEMGVSVGYAECSGDFSDPAAWSVVQAGGEPALRQFPNPDVVCIGGVYFAFGDPPTGLPHPWTTRKVTEAVSLDGINWAVLGFVQPDADAPAIHVAQAFVRPEGSNWWLYVTYACQIGGDPDYDYRYNRVRTMRRLVTPSELASYEALLAPAKPVPEP